MNTTIFLNVLKPHFAFTASITYISVAVVKKIPIRPIGPSLMLAGFQAFFSVKSCAVFLYFGHQYGKMLDDEVGLITDIEVNEDTANTVEEEVTA